MQQYADNTIRKVRTISGTITVFSAVFLAIFSAAESSCDLGIVGGITRLFDGERWQFLGAVVRWIPVLLILSIVLFVVVRLPSKGLIGISITALMTVVALFSAAYTLYRYIPTVIDELTIYHLRNEIRQDRFILHAGGFMPGNDGEDMYLSNSVQALDNYRKNGTTRFLELDLLITSDNDVICAHKWKSIYIDGERLKKPVTKAEVLRGFYKDTPYNPASIDDVVALLRERPDVMVITDAKDDNADCMSIIAEKWPDLRDRFIVQIFHESEYQQIRDLGFPFIIFTIYSTDEEERSYAALRKACATHHLVGITMPAVWMNPNKNPEFAAQIDLVLSLNTPIYCHTIDREKRMRECFAMGFDALYTNVVAPEV